MFLIEISSGCFVDGEDLQWIKVEKDKIAFILKSDCETSMTVDKDYQSAFVNNLQAINQNISNVESSYVKSQK